MGKILVSVVSLIVCGEFFAAGLIKSGFMGTLITAANDAGFGLATMVIVGGALVWLFSFIMGSGNAAFFSFAPLLPNVAHVIGVPIIQLIFPLQVILAAPLPRLPAPLWPSLDWQGYLHSKSQREHSFRCSLALPLPTLPTSCSGTNSQQKTQCGGTRRPPAHHDPTTSLLRRSSNGRQYYPHSQRPRRPVC